jgi:leader peptidase (prepilin peptidase)/N-methyltransferase
MNDAIEVVGSNPDLRPNFAVLLGGATAIAIVSGLSLAWPVAVMSTVLGALMIAGADVDARTYLLPDIVTFGGAISGIAAAPFIDAFEPYGHGAWLAMASALGRAVCAAMLLALLRRCYAWIRGREGLGLGDVKLAAAIGAWLPVEAIPLCFGFAASAALVVVMVGHLRGQFVHEAMKLPFGAFLCPALWLVFYANALPGQY